MRSYPLLCLLCGFYKFDWKLQRRRGDQQRHCIGKGHTTCYPVPVCAPPAALMANIVLSSVSPPPRSHYPVRAPLAAMVADIVPLSVSSPSCSQHLEHQHSPACSVVHSHQSCQSASPCNRVTNRHRHASPAQFSWQESWLYYRSPFPSHTCCVDYPTRYMSPARSG